MSSVSPTSTELNDPTISIAQAHAPETLILRAHDPISPDDDDDDDDTAWVWPSKSQRLLLERERLLPLSPISSAPPSVASSESSHSRNVSLQCTTESAAKCKPEVTYSLVTADASCSGIIRSSSAFLAVERPAIMPRSASSPVRVLGRQLSLTELISSGLEDEANQEVEDDLHPHPHRRKGLTVRREGSVSIKASDTIKDDLEEHNRLGQLKPSTAYARRRCCSSPSIANSPSPRIPLSSFTDIWR